MEYLGEIKREASRINPRAVGRRKVETTCEGEGLWPNPQGWASTGQGSNSVEDDGLTHGQWGARSEGSDC